MKPDQRKGVPRELFAASISPSSVDAENRAVDVVFYTGAKVQRGGFFSDPYFLTLSLDPAHVRLGRLNNGATVLDSFCRETTGLQENSPPRLRRGCGAQRRGGGARFRNPDTGLAFPGLFEPPRRGQWLRLPLLIQGGEPKCRVLRQKLDSHSDWSLKDVIGDVEKGWLENGQAVAKLRFSDRAEVEPVWNDIKNGIIRNISVGAVIHQKKEITAEGEVVKSYLAVDWETMEISVVPIPADPGAGFLGYEDPVPDIPRASALEKTENTTMEEQATITGESRQDARAQIDLEAVKEKARLAEWDLVTGIRKAVKAAGLAF